MLKYRKQKSTKLTESRKSNINHKHPTTLKKKTQSYNQRQSTTYDSNNLIGTFNECDGGKPDI